MVALLLSPRKGGFRCLDIEGAFHCACVRVFVQQKVKVLTFRVCLLIRIIIPVVVLFVSGAKFRSFFLRYFRDPWLEQEANGMAPRWRKAVVMTTS